MKILLVDDDSELVALLVFALQRAEFETLSAQDGPTMFRLIEEEQPDVVLLDVNLGRWNGFDLLHELRQTSNLPVIMLTERNGEDDKVVGLDTGANDYLPKPFSYRELVARIRVQLRHSKPQMAAVHSAPLRIGRLSLHPDEHRVTIDGQPIHLTVTEFRVLHFLMSRGGSLVSSRTLLKQVWGYNDASGKDVVRVTLFRLRRRLEAAPHTLRILHTVPGLGVQLRPEYE